MTISEDITQVWQEKSQREDLFDARAIFQNAIDNVTNAYLEIEDIEQKGSFQTIPESIQTVIVRGKQMLKDLYIAVNSDEEVKKFYQWMP